ncbi:MAG: DM13 domain-containing protein [Solirubrobacteraceae bacterium]
MSVFASPSRVGLPARLLLVPIVLVALVGGVWVTGGLITDDFKVAMALTGVWIGLLGAGCLVLALRRRELAPWLIGTYLVATAVVGGYLAMTTLLDDVVDERVVTADVPAARVADGAAGKRAAPRARPAAPQNVLLGRGQFRGVSHPASGTASTIDRANGGAVLTLTNFEVDNGPDLRVLLVAGPATGAGDLGDREDLGALKGNKGNQQYTIPAGLDLARYRRVVIWCRAFSVNFARAGLRSA